MSTRDELPIAGDDVLSRDHLGRRGQRAGENDVVDTETQDDVPDTGLIEHVAFEARQARLAEHGAESPAGRLPRTVVQEAVADDPLIQHAKLRLPARRPLQSPPQPLPAP